MAEIRLSKSHLFYNLATLSRLAGSLARIMAVLKDNAYGHGLKEFAPLVAAYGIRSVAVRTNREAAIVSPLFEEVLILADRPDVALIDHCHYALNDMIHMKHFPAGTTVHLKVDTGMGRNGVAAAEVIASVKALIAHGLKLGGVFSHLAGADELDGSFKEQEAVFASVRQRIEVYCDENALPYPLFHLYNSAGLMRRDGTPDRYDRVRPGIALYGYGDLPAALGVRDLKPVLSLWGDRLSTRTLQRGDRVGYGGVFKAPEAMVASTYDVGYGDGFLRLSGEEGYTTPEGRRVLGRVSMDNMSIEGEADRLCILGDADHLARLRGTISYEVLVRLSPAIKRVVEP